MIDEKIVIGILEKRIDSFVKQHPEQKDCEKVQTVKEFIQLLEQAEKEQRGNIGWIPCSKQLPDKAGYNVLATIENSFGQRRVTIIFTGYGDESFWHCNNKEYDLEVWKVIAWQPLPEPYQPKGE